MELGDHPQVSRDVGDGGQGAQIDPFLAVGDMAQQAAIALRILVQQEAECVVGGVVACAGEESADGPAWPAALRLTAGRWPRSLPAAASTDCRRSNPQEVSRQSTRNPPKEE